MSGVKSGLAAAKEHGMKLGRQPGQCPKADKVAPRVLQAKEEGWAIDGLPGIWASPKTPC